MIHKRLRTNNIFVDRETVRVALKLLSQEGVALRQVHQFHEQKYIVKGPNQLWCMNSNDKLKPFCFNIHGCIDGYSRKVLWIETCSSNKMPEFSLYFTWVLLLN